MSRPPTLFHRPSIPSGSGTIQFHNPIWRTIAGSRKLSIYDTLRTKSSESTNRAFPSSFSFPPTMRDVSCGMSGNAISVRRIRLRSRARFLALFAPAITIKIRSRMTPDPHAQLFPICSWNYSNASRRLARLDINIAR